MEQQFDKTKFSFTELFLNTNGKTSVTKAIGFGASFVCITMFVAMMIFYMVHPAESETVLLFIDKIITFFGISAGLMGIKSISSSFGQNHRVTIDNTAEKKEEKKPDPVE